MLAAGLKGLAHGVLADEIDRLAAERDQWCAEATSRARRDGMKRAYVDGIMAELQAVLAVRDALQAEVDAWKGASGLTSSIAPNAVTPDNLRIVLRDSKVYCQKLQAEVDAWKAKADRLKAERDRAEASEAATHGALCKLQTERGAQAVVNQEVTRRMQVNNALRARVQKLERRAEKRKRFTNRVVTELKAKRAEVERLQAERDEARVEVERLRGQVERFNAEGPEAFRNRVLEVLGAPRDCTPETAAIAIRLMKRQRDEAWDEIKEWKSASGLDRGGDSDAVTPADLASEVESLRKMAEQPYRDREALQAQVSEQQAAVERWKRVHDIQLDAKTRARLENAHLRAGLTKIASGDHPSARISNGGRCDATCSACIAVEAIRQADAAGAPRDTEPTGQKVVTADGRLADVCFDGLVRPAKPALVVIESPYAGDVEANVAYARAALLDSLRRGEAPLASHLLYTQVLDDQESELRAQGINAGCAWTRHADKVAVYQGRGISDGMRQGIALAESLGIEVEFREVVADLPKVKHFSDETVAQGRMPRHVGPGGAVYDLRADEGVGEG